MILYILDNALIDTQYYIKMQDIMDERIYIHNWTYCIYALILLVISWYKKLSQSVISMLAHNPKSLFPL